MIQTLEAVIDEHGTVRLLEDVHLPAARRALVTILEDEPTVRSTARLCRILLTSSRSRHESVAVHEGWAGPCCIIPHSQPDKILTNRSRSRLRRVRRLILCGLHAMSQRIILITGANGDLG